MAERSGVAFLFPGQGSQRPGMGKSLHDARPEARAVFEEADEALGFPISDLCFEGDAAELQRTENTQPALLTVSLAVHRVLEAEGVVPGSVAGHSLGEYSALVAAGSLDLADAVRLVRQRGRFMQEAVPLGEGTMAAVIGLDDEVVAEVCREVTAEGGGVVEPANFNSPGQVVVAGQTGAVERAVEAARGRGARRALMLDVSAPFHCSLMRPAAERLAQELREVEVRAPAIPVVCNVDAEPVSEPEAIRDALGRQVTAPVRWVECLRRMEAEGTDIWVEAGPGRVLAGLARRTVESRRIHSVEEPEEIEALVDGLGG